jgi:hypothetical protein
MSGKAQPRPLLIQPEDHRLIALTQGQVTKVDIADYEWLSQWTWHADCNINGKSFRARRCESRPGLHSKGILMHVQIMNPPGGFVPDHVNHDALDNRRGNLRLATIGQNNCNQRVRRDNTSGHKGVTWHKAANGWAAQININGNRSHLGIYDKLEDAAKAYQLAAESVYGDFACLEHR